MNQIITAFFLLLPFNLFCQDTIIQYEQKMIRMPVAIVRSDLNIPSFIQHVMNDTSFHKAFKNLRVLEFSSYNDIKMMNKKGKSIATLKSKTQQIRKNNCRLTKIIEEESSGDFYTKKKEYNYYTAQLYASLFFSNTEVCRLIKKVKKKKIKVLCMY